ncbi:excitatory amino acid transporter-like [Littorina saxatilis]|uniref:Amino acid transporter n=1 Tax=Littorina saxatilis TaxID=31220 RepID=A0AAN9B3T3_9CAEN
MALDTKRWCTRGCCRDFLRVNLLVILTVVGVIVGFIVGFGIRTLQPSQDAVIWIGLPGEVYMRMLKMMILPLIICSVITGTASLDPKCNGKVSAVALTYLMATNCISCVVAIAMAFAIKPGLGVEQTEVSEKVSGQVMETSDIFVDLIRNLFPDNVVSACFEKALTKYSQVESHTVTNVSGQLVNQTVITKVKGVGTAPATNVLGLVLCCMVFGMATTAVGPAGRPFFAFFNSANEVIMRILRWFVWTTPVGVASLIAVALLGTGDLGKAVRSLGMFAVTVTSSLAAYQFLVVPLYFFALTRQNPFTLLLTLGRPWMVSFAAASSAIAIPETLHSLEHVNHVDRRITRFVVPFAASINRDGSSIFIAVSCIFIAQLSGMDLNAAKIVLLWVLTTVISVAIPSVPSAGVVSVLINLTALNIPADSIGLLFAMEWILDRLRSASNMLSHAYCAVTTYVLCKGSLPPLDIDGAAIGEDIAAFEINVPPPAADKTSNSIDVTDRLLKDSIV